MKNCKINAFVYTRHMWAKSILHRSCPLTIWVTHFSQFQGFRYLCLYVARPTIRYLDVSLDILIFVRPCVRYLQRTCGPMHANDLMLHSITLLASLKTGNNSLFSFHFFFLSYCSALVQYFPFFALSSH